MSHKRPHENPIMDLPNIPLSDHNMWYYPSHGHDSDEDDLPVGSKHGNWGCKTAKGARWVRRGKITPWGPGMEDWENEERARKRLKLLLPQERRSPSPPALPHLSRSPSPPLTSPYTPPASAHLSYSSFVMDKSVTHTFRSKLLDELEQATNGLIEGEATLRNALGRLWQVMSEDPEERREATTTTAAGNGANLGTSATVDESVITKLEEDEEENEEEQSERGRRLGRAPDLTPTTHKIFLYHNGGAATGGGAGGGGGGSGVGSGTGSGEQPSGYDSSSHFSQPETQLDSLQKSLLMLRELQDNGREYVERLQEIRESLGDIRAQRNTVWDVVRGRAVKELQDAAVVAAAGVSTMAVGGSSRH